MKGPLDYSHFLGDPNMFLINTAVFILTKRNLEDYRSFLSRCNPIYPEQPENSMLYYLTELGKCQVIT